MTDMAKGHLRSALNQIIASPTPSNRANVEALMIDFIVEQTNPSGTKVLVSVVQGVCPVLAGEGKKHDHAGRRAARLPRPVLLPSRFTPFRLH